MLRGIRVQLKTTNDMKEGEVLMALTSDETQSVIWLEGLAELIGSKAVKRYLDIGYCSYSNLKNRKPRKYQLKYFQ